MKRTPRWLIAILLLPVLAFCAFGFLATFEPGDAATMWTWRIIYGAAGIGSMIGMLWLVLPRPLIRLRPW